MGWFVLVLGCAGDVTLVAQLDHAAGLQAGSPVTASGVQVGEVRSLAVAGGGVQVTLDVGHEHDLALHADACVQLLPLADGMGLLLLTGDTGIYADTPLPACSVSDVFGDLGEMMEGAVKALQDAVPNARALGENLGDATREFTEGLDAGLAGPGKD